jgi:hypothetical protein
MCYEKACSALFPIVNSSELQRPTPGEQNIPEHDLISEPNSPGLIGDRSEDEDDEEDAYSQ